MTILVAVPDIFRPLLPQVREGQRVLLIDRNEVVAEVAAPADPTALPRGFDGDPILTADWAVPLPTDEFGIWTTG
jgi:hypothetical protein